MDSNTNHTLLTLDNDRKISFAPNFSFHISNDFFLCADQRVKKFGMIKLTREQYLLALWLHTKEYETNVTHFLLSRKAEDKQMIKYYVPNLKIQRFSVMWLIVVWWGPTNCRIKMINDSVRFHELNTHKYIVHYNYSTLSEDNESYVTRQCGFYNWTQIITIINSIEIWIIEFWNNWISATDSRDGAAYCLKIHPAATMIWKIN